MLRHLPAPLTGILAALLFSLNTILWASMLFVIAFLRLIPIKVWQAKCTKLIHVFPIIWNTCNNVIIHLTTKIEWDVKGVENLKPDDWYLVIANHRSWIDILVLFKVFHKKIPLLKYFMKKALLWQIPVAAQACYLMDFPFMERYSKSYLQKHPELKGKDIETTRKVCEKFKTMPTSVMVFVEGGRNTSERHARQNSPYKYLLKPRAGGMAFVLETMGTILHKLIDVTIVYPDEPVGAWAFLTGKIKKIIVHAQAMPITEEILGDYENSREFRAQFQTWLNKRWEKKDKYIGDLLARNSNVHLANLSTSVPSSSAKAEDPD